MEKLQATDSPGHIQELVWIACFLYGAMHIHNIKVFNFCPSNILEAIILYSHTL